MGEPVTRLAYLGPEGTFTHQAALTWIDEGVAASPLPDVAAVYRGVEEGRFDVGVVPIENSVEGYVVPSLEELLASENVVAMGATSVDITFSAFARSAADAQHAQVVVSHPHALAQCRRFINDRELRPLTASSTGAACRDLQAGHLSLGAPLCRELYSLHLVAEHVEDYPGARTRFLLIGSRERARATIGSGEPTSETILAVTPQRIGPGVLSDVTHVFFDRRINLTSVVTRPLKAQEGKYVFVFTLEGHPAQPDTRRCLEELLEQGNYLKVLGTYPSPRGPLTEGPLREFPPSSVTLSSDPETMARALLW